ncbi:hypothetical protein HPB51_005043 [Rhipicephalus microplus]|uniref:Uncharacterized protein n=1 Tax=Rhipicephalus microplus TaxID=6941 RepID=A0A9J6DDR6_RHIMP|nr:hypothetical protein HPB51_025518 [Rhipicephalus microplus]KAH8021362.1 hypothetical protein HPB51_015509 [Rhipicephalus microplus]KAH8030869.1 hypothetical protein HPB51_012209 [Rhipicephalus microplus]KAH8033021.1 hypothetical protein HPB51_005043 [Rhipicephalus microplus]
MITHAYVRYQDDKHLAIVPVEDIKNFNPNEDYSTAFFMVKWTDSTGTCAYYRARILRVGESEQDLKEIVSRKRVRVRPLIEDSDQASDGDSNVAPSKVDIGQGLRIPLETWRRVQARDKDSLFIKDLLVTIWDPAQLQGRSLQGKHCPRFPNRPRKDPLTPWKVSVMRTCYKRRLEKQGFPDSAVQTLMKRMNHYVGEKIADIDKMAKRVQRD